MRLKISWVDTLKGLLLESPLITYKQTVAIETAIRYAETQAPNYCCQCCGIKEKMDTDELTLGQIKELKTMFGGDCASNDSGPWKVGSKYIIRTVTMIQVGMLKYVGDKELVLSDASWIAYTNRYHDTLKNGTFDEVEPFTDDCIVGRGSIVDAQQWHHDLPTEQK